MAVISGINGAVNGISTVGKWTIRPSKTLATANASNTAAGPISTPGNFDCTIEMIVYGKTPPAYPGDSVSFVGQTGGGSYAITGVCERTVGNFPIEQGGYIVWTVTIGGNGGLTRGSTSVTDTSAPAMFVASPCKIQRAPVSTYADLPAVQSFTLDFSKSIQTYVSSQTVMRVPAVYKATMQVDLREGDPAGIPSEGDIALYRAFVDSTNYFQINFGALQSVEHDVPIEGGGLVAARLTLEWTAWDNSSTRVRGVISKPAGAGNWWV